MKRALKEKFFEILPFLIIFNVFLIIINYVNLDNTQLTRIIPIFFAINFFLIITCFCVDFKKIIRVFRSIKRKTWIFLLLILLVALAARLYTPNTHRLYFDEDIYLNVAQNIANDGRAILCNRGSPDYCEEGVLNKQPQGLPFFMSVFFLFTGANELVASYIMIIISALSSIALFFFVYLLTKKEEPALYSALILALTPIHIMWAQTITGGNLFVFFSLLAMIAILVYFENKSIATVFLAFSLLAYASQLRPEAPLLIPVVGLFFLRKKLNKEVLAGFTLLLILFSPYVFQLENVSGENWGASGQKFGLQYFFPNLEVNSQFFFDNERYPVLFTILALPGLVYLIINKKYDILSTLLAWFALFFFIYTLFYAGSFDYGVDVRFSMTMYAAISSLIGLGIYYLRTLLPVKRKFIASAILIIVIIFSFSKFIPFVGAVHEESWMSRISHDFGIQSAKEAGDNCYILTHSPSMFLVNQVSALQTWMASDDKVMDKVFKESDCVLFDEGYWCMTVDRFKEGVCKYVKDHYDTEVLNSVTHRELTFTLYKIERKS